MSGRRVRPGGVATAALDSTLGAGNAGPAAVERSTARQREVLRSVRCLGAEGRDFLRLASSLAGAPIPALSDHDRGIRTRCGGRHRIVPVVHDGAVVPLALDHHVGDAERTRAANKAESDQAQGP